MLTTDYLHSTLTRSARPLIRHTALYPQRAANVNGWQEPDVRETQILAEQQGPIITTIENADG